MTAPPTRYAISGPPIAASPPVLANLNTHPHRANSDDPCQHEPGDECSIPAMSGIHATRRLPRADFLEPSERKPQHAEFRDQLTPPVHGSRLLSHEDPIKKARNRLPHGWVPPL